MPTSPDSTPHSADDSASHSGSAGRSPQEVFADHGRRLGTRDLDHISANYTADAVVIGPAGALHGRACVRDAVGRLLRELPDAVWHLDPQFAGDVLLLQWSARTETHEVVDGVDTFLFDDGLIRAQTLHYTLRERTP